MNQVELQTLTEERIKDAKALLDGQRWAFAYYTAGYAVECALKSCLLARMVHTGWIFQDKANVKDCLTHDFGDLIKLAGLHPELVAKLAASGAFVGYWGTVSLWQVTTRYVPKTTGRGGGALRSDHSRPRRGTEVDTELLVGNRIDDGRRLLVELVRDGFDVSAAAWLEPSEERWALYVGSKSLDAGKVADAYRIVYACLQRLPNPSVDLSVVKLIPTSDPVARDVATVREQYSGGRLPIRYKGESLGGIAIESAYIYPRITPGLTRDEVLQTVTGLMNRADPVRPSTVTLRDGTTVRGVPYGLEMKRSVGQPAVLEIKILDDADGSTHLIPADDVTNIL